jgi:thioredoxin-related protein
MTKKTYFATLALMCLLSINLFADADKVKTEPKDDKAVKVEAESSKIPRSGPTTPEGWYDDYDLAIKAAQEKNQKIFALFTGSDWCRFCIILKQNTLDKDEFKDYAKENLVLLYIDLPRQADISKEMREKNMDLMKKFNVRGYPTSAVLDDHGVEQDRIVGAPPNFMNQLKDIIEK